MFSPKFTIGRFLFSAVLYDPVVDTDPSKALKFRGFIRTTPFETDRFPLILSISIFWKMTFLRFALSDKSKFSGTSMTLMVVVSVFPSVSVLTSSELLIKSFKFRYEEVKERLPFKVSFFKK